MKYSVDKTITRFLEVSLCLFAFSVAWSSALYRISLLLILVGVPIHAVLLIAKSELQFRDIISRNSEKMQYLLAPVGLYCWIALTWFWTPASTELYANDLWAYTKLMAIPLFSIYLYRLFPNRLESMLYAYGLGVIVLMVPTYLDFLGFFRFFGLHVEGNTSYFPENGVSRNLVYWKNQIIHGFHVSLLLAFLVHLMPAKGKRRYLHFVIIGLCVLDIGYLIAGRMAIFSLVVAAVTALPGQYFSQRRGLLVLTGFAFLSAVIVSFDSSVSSRLYSIWDQSARFFQSHDITTSSGIRLYYWSLSFENFMKHPLLGGGAGSFRESLVLLNPELASQNHFHPHNEYIAIVSQFGIIGFSWFLWMLGGLWFGIRRVPLGAMRSCVLSFIAVFCVNALSDASLHNIWEGWTFVLLSSVGFAFIFENQRGLSDGKSAAYPTAFH